MFSMKKAVALALVVSTLSVSGAAFAGHKSLHGSFSGPKHSGWEQPHNPRRHGPSHGTHRIKRVGVKRAHIPHGGGVRHQPHKFRRFGSRR